MRLLPVRTSLLGQSSKHLHNEDIFQESIFLPHLEYAQAKLPSHRPETQSLEQ